MTRYLVSKNTKTAIPNDEGDHLFIKGKVFSFEELNSEECFVDKKLKKLKSPYQVLDTIKKLYFDEETVISINGVFLTTEEIDEAFVCRLSKEQYKIVGVISSIEEACYILKLNRNSDGLSKYTLEAFDADEGFEKISEHKGFEKISENKTIELVIKDDKETVVFKENGVFGYEDASRTMKEIMEVINS